MAIIPVAAKSGRFRDVRAPGLAPRAEHPALAAAVVIYGPSPTLRLRLNAGCGVLGHSAADDSWDVAAGTGLVDHYPTADGSLGDHIPDPAEHRRFNSATPDSSTEVPAIQAVHPPLPS